LEWEETGNTERRIQFGHGKGSVFSSTGGIRGVEAKVISKQRISADGRTRTADLRKGSGRESTRGGINPKQGLVGRGRRIFGSEGTTQGHRKGKAESKANERGIGRWSWGI